MHIKLHAISLEIDTFVFVHVAQIEFKYNLCLEYKYYKSKMEHINNIQLMINEKICTKNP